MDSNNLTLELPQLRDDQMRIVMHPARVKVLSMGRRWGKTVMGGVVIVNVLRQHGRAAWVAPNYKNTRPLWRFLTSAVTPLVNAGIAQVSRSERTVTTSSGGEIVLYSGDNIDSIRGESFDLVVMDEAAKLPEGAWTDAIMPTLADRGGQAILISTPRGRNWFYMEFLAAQADGKYAAAWQAPSTSNPMPSIREAAEMARLRVPEMTYRQEWLAEFVDSGGVFRNVLNVSIGEVEEPKENAHYVFGVDWAFSNDFTVVCVMDALTNAQVYLDRYTGMDYSLQRKRIEALAKRYPPAVIVAESNAMGRPNNEELRRMGLPVRDFVTASASKAEVIETLAGKLERGEIVLLNDPVQIAELQAYEGERLVSGMTRYSAPDGMHDDTVIALALAVHGVGDGVGESVWVNPIDPLENLKLVF